MVPSQVICEQTKFLLKFGMHNEGALSSLFFWLSLFVHSNLYAIVPADWQPEDRAKQWQGMLNDMKNHSSQNTEALKNQAAALETKVDGMETKIEALDTKMNTKIEALDAKMEEMLALLRQLKDPQ